MIYLLLLIIINNNLLNKYLNFMNLAGDSILSDVWSDVRVS